jgi:predicted nucleic acid-binding Zn ribbon protein
MSWKSVNDILGVLEQQAKWREEPFQLVLQCWAEIVGTAAAKHSRPLSMQRDVLRVATSSAAWAQNLTFSRRTLLNKLNTKLSVSLLDIRFSTAGWQHSPEIVKPESTVLPREHPSYLGDSDSYHTDVQPTGQNAHQAFEFWAKTIQVRSQSLPLCPQCQCPTPPGELQRWSVCALCSAKQSSHNLYEDRG